MSGATAPDQGPIVVGGLGGSGTRSVAVALEAAGVYMGYDLNDAHDNLWFTLLCKRPCWLPGQLTGLRPARGVLDALSVLAALMTGRDLDRAELSVLAGAAADMAAWGHDARGAMAGSRAFTLAASALQATRAECHWWGWKEPNSHLLLPELIEAFPGLCYVHVLRHPLDMAFSRNTMQMRLWGPAFGIETPSDDADDPNAQLRWWILSTRMALEVGEQLGTRFRLLRFEEFSARPRRALEDLCAAFGLALGPDELASAVAHVEQPVTSGRWREARWQDLDPGLVQTAAAFGYDAPTRRLAWKRLARSLARPTDKP